MTRWSPSPPGQSICGTSAAYFVTLGNRLIDFQAGNGTDCIGDIGWTQNGAFAGAIQNSHSYSLSSSSEQETKTSHFCNRHYGAEHGRFLQEDPIGFCGRTQPVRGRGQSSGHVHGSVWPLPRRHGRGWKDEPAYRLPSWIQGVCTRLWRCA